MYFPIWIWGINNKKKKKLFYISSRNKCHLKIYFLLILTSVMEHTLTYLIDFLPPILKKKKHIRRVPNTLMMTTHSTTLTLRLILSLASYINSSLIFLFSNVKNAKKKEFINIISYCCWSERSHNNWTEFNIIVPSSLIVNAFSESFDYFSKTLLRELTYLHIRSHTLNIYVVTVWDVWAKDKAVLYNFKIYEWVEIYGWYFVYITLKKRVQFELDSFKHYFIWDQFPSFWKIQGWI